MEPLLFLPVIYHHIETAGHGNEKLMAFLQRVPGPIRATRYVVKVEDTLDGERDVPIPLDKRQVASWVGNFGQINDVTLVDFHKSITGLYPALAQPFMHRPPRSAPPDVSYR